MQEQNHLQLNDKQVIEQVLAGQTNAYGNLVKRYWKLALAVAYTRCQNTASAEDLAQDGFIKAYMHLASLEDRSKFAGWLTKIIHQECISHHRKKQVSIHVDPVSIDHLKPVFTIQDNPGLSQHQINLVHRAIQKLPPYLQDVVMMRFVGGLPLKQIAEQIETKYGTVRVWLHRAYKLLKEDLAPVLKEVQS
jgi:RNA polymerase sigma-70 factor (ECF subfamily)